MVNRLKIIGPYNSGGVQHSDEYNYPILLEFQFKTTVIEFFPEI